MGRLDNKVAIITGAAKGIGLSCAQRFVNEGARVIGTDVDEETGRENISKLGDNAIFIRHDVSKEEEWKKVFAEAEKRFGKVDILVNNAGILEFNNAEEIDGDMWHKILSVDLDGVMWGVKQAIPAMKKMVVQSSIFLQSQV